MSLSPDDAKAHDSALIAQYADYLEKRIDESLSKRRILSRVVVLDYASFMHADMPYHGECGLLSPAVEAEVAHRYSAKGWEKVWFKRCPTDCPGLEFGHLEVHFE